MRVGDRWIVGDTLRRFSREGLQDKVELLLREHGADLVNIPDLHGSTALSVCCQRGHVAVAETLLDANADIDQNVMV